MDPGKQDTLTFRGFWYAYVGLFGLAVSIIIDVPPNMLGIVVKAGFGVLALLGIVLCLAARSAESVAQNHVILSRGGTAPQENKDSEHRVCPDPSQSG